MPDQVVHWPVSDSVRDRIQRAIESLSDPTPEQKWQATCRVARQSPIAAEALRWLWQQTFPDRQLSQNPMWWPDENVLSEANLTRWMRELGLPTYADLHRWSAQQRPDFWQRAISETQIVFAESPKTILDDSPGAENPRWLPDAKLNIVNSCFSADKQSVAIIHQQPGGPLRRMTVDELQQLTCRVASGLQAAGYRPGDAVGVVLPMTAESVAIYLGIVSAGCAVVSIADSFAAPEIAKRLTIAGARAVFTYDYMVRGGKSIPLYQRVCEATNLPIIALPKDQEDSVALRPQDMAWKTFLSEQTIFDPVVADAYDTINVLFSSGTTGDPKAIPWKHLTPIKCAVDGWAHQDIHPGDVLAWPTNLGWMMGPWLIFASLINRGTVALYDDAPLDEGFGRFVQDARVTMLGVVPTIVKVWRKSGCMESLDWTAIRCFSSTGEASGAEDMFYLSALAGMKPVIEYCGGTEIGGGYITSTVVQPNVAAAFTTPSVGLDFVLLDEAGHPSEEGELFLIPPSIGLSQQLLNRDHHETYYAGVPRGPGGQLLRRHGDFMWRLPGEIYVAGGRVDDTMNLGGIKISSAEIERTLNLIDGIKETAAVAFADGQGPEQLAIFAVADQAWDTDELKTEMNRRIKTQLNPLFKVLRVELIDQMPRTVSGKVMRRKLRDQLT